MIHEIAPHRFCGSFTPRSVSLQDILFVFQGDTVLLKEEDGQMVLPTVQLLGIAPEKCRSLFALDNQWYSMYACAEFTPPEGFSYYTKHQYRKLRPLHSLFACATAGSLNRWYAANRFCGSCGAQTQDHAEERALICPVCGKKIYPKIMPAVIAAVRSGDKLLLTRYQGPAGKRAALVAGFNEIGESIEETLHREVMEEVGLHVKNLQFYKSQPWVLTDSLMIGFFCDLDGDDTITLQESELSSGTWVKREDLPPDTDGLSLTAEMIDMFRLGLD